MGIAIQDVRYAIRIFSRRPGFTAVAVLALALGISSTTTVFSVVNAVLLSSLPVEHLDRLVMLWQQDLTTGRDRITVSPTEYREYASGQTSFDALAALRGVSLSVSLGDVPSAAEGIQVTPNFLETLGIKPLRGRGFNQAGATAAGQEALVTYEFWQRGLGADSNVLGQVLTLRAGFTGAAPRANPIDGPYVIIGVLPPGLKLPYRAADIWIPLAPEYQAATGPGGLLVFARLKRGVTLAQASSDVGAAARRLSAQFPDRGTNMTAWLVTLRTEDIGDISPTLILLASSVALLSLIVCANIGNMLLSRLTERQRELAVRRALGASRLRVVQQLLTEAALLAAAGTVAGVLMAVWMTQAIALVGPATIPRVNDVRVDGWALAAALGTAFVMSLVFGLAPAFRIARSTAGNPLAQRGGSGAAIGRLQEVLVISEFALAFAVLVGAGLVVTSSRALETASVGYDPRNVLTFRVALPQAQYARPEMRAAFFEVLLDRLRALPGVAGAGAVNILPQMDTNRNVRFELDAGPGPAASEPPNARFRIATPGYFQSLGIRVLRGRDFQAADVAAGALVVSRSMAERFWSTGDPLGRRLRLALPTETTRWMPVVGVVDDVRQWINTPGEPTLYWVNLQQPGFAFAIRTATEPTTLSNAVTQVVRGIDLQQPVFDVQSMRQRLDHSQQLTYERFRTAVMVAFGAAALLLSGLGIYGVARYAVLQRMQEFGIRIALGASAQQVVVMVLSQSLRSVLIGGVIGSVASIALGRLLSSVLYGAATSEPPIVVAVAVVLGALATLAALGPARRAGRADPMQALRGD